ncbi:hypothetical protein [Propionibacterium australiense]|uniref:hypothetical protein n=1 Tax=Propionibacterium australiense TaxID=119981 RepID=UPI0015FEE534|nr:hypothetical protein [Propionibacterium australiense]
MGRRVRSEIRLVDLPAAQRELAGLARLDRDGMYMAELCAQIRRPDFGLWWVSRPMTVLAAHEAAQIPAWDGVAVRPERAGLIAWQGGTGISFPVYTPGFREPRRVEAYGMLWWGSDGWARTQALVRTVDAARVGALLDGDTTSLLTPIIPPDPPLAPEGAGMAEEKRVADLWATSVILASVPKVGGVQRRRLDRPPGLPGRPRHAPRVNVAVLRESERAPQRPGDDDTRGDGRSWRLVERHPVRGHWRQQACGPNRALRRPVYVLPYMRGPEGAPVREAPRVNAWRRL